MILQSAFLHSILTTKNQYLSYKFSRHFNGEISIQTIFLSPQYIGNCSAFQELWHANWHNNCLWRRATIIGVHIYLLYILYILCTIIGGQLFGCRIKVQPVELLFAASQSLCHNNWQNNCLCKLLHKNSGFELKNPENFLVAPILVAP